MIVHSEIKAIKELDHGTELIVGVNEKVKEHILRCREGGKVIAELRISDGREITNEQRKKFYASCKDIADYMGEFPEYVKEYFKFIYCYKNRKESISLSSCSVTEARELINELMDFCIEHGVQLSDTGINRTDDIDRYLYSCLRFRRCAITGKPNADIHHCEGSRVGMGGNRKEISNKGRKLIALSREWHNKVHTEGEEEIFKKYKIYGIELDDFSLKSLKISKGDMK